MYILRDPPLLSGLRAIGCEETALQIILLERDRTPRCTAYHVALNCHFLPPNMLSGIGAVLC